MLCRKITAVTTLFLMLAACRLTLAAAESPKEKPLRPNIIFILTDDQGFGDAKCFGHPKLITPTLDKLAAEGTVFEQFYVNNPVCSPSRTAFMTGHYPVRHHVHGHFADQKMNARRKMPNYLNPDATTVTDLLKKAGYATAHFGKWHLSGGSGDISGYATPADYGIEEARIATGNGPRYEVQKGEKYFRAKSTGLFVDETLKFIRKVRKETPDKPFYVNLWTLVPHATLKPTPEELAVYDDLKIKPEDFTGWMRQYTADAKDLEQQAKVYFASMTGMDKALGRLVAELEKMGLAKNTLIFFTSDNGPEDYKIGNASNAGMGSPGTHRARKRSIYEGGVNTPCIVWMPGKVPAGRVVKDRVWTAVDWLPTACKLAGAKVPANLKPDGEDRSDILFGDGELRKKPIYWEWRSGVANYPAYQPPGLAIRDGKWKLFLDIDDFNNPNAKVELYDIPADREERKNVAAENPEVVQRLRKKLVEWKKTLP